MGAEVTKDGPDLEITAAVSHACPRAGKAAEGISEINAVSQNSQRISAVAEINGKSRAVLRKRSTVK